jgi:hypothetical protein
LVSRAATQTYTGRDQEKAKGCMSLDEETKIENANKVMQTALEDALKKAGIHLDYSTAKLKELIESTDVKQHYDLVLCEWKEAPPLAALNIQIRALDMAFRLLDAYPAEKHKHEITDHVDLEQRLRKALHGPEDK